MDRMFLQTVDSCLFTTSSVFITEACWYNFISGLVDSVRLFDKIVIYHDNEPDIDNSVKTKWIKIKNLSQGKSLIINYSS